MNDPCKAKNDLNFKLTFNEPKNKSLNKSCKQKADLQNAYPNPQTTNSIFNANFLSTPTFSTYSN